MSDIPQLDIAQYDKKQLLPKEAFLKKFGISETQFENTKLNWTDLEKIHDDYVSNIEAFENAAKIMSDILLTKEAKDRGIHSVRYRTKSSEGLIEKIIRKTIEKPSHVAITVTNYTNKITDLIGVRALHVFKNDWYNIHHFILSKWNLKRGEKVTAYYREGDSDDFLAACKSNKCKTQIHPKGYRSIHYIIETSLTKQKFFVEIQVRTIFEEGWSEIDHKLRYFSKKDAKHPLDRHISILNRISGSADEIGALIKQVEFELQREEAQKNNDAQQATDKNKE
jgi:ppGpp synthetase/RelA/SpoT-type nucleotidyltranferase